MNWFPEYLDTHRTQTTRIYADPSMEMMREAMERNKATVPDEAPLWLDDEEELARLCGIR